MKAVALNISAWMLLPVMDGMAKHLSTEIHFLEVVWGRYFFMVVISVPITFVFFKKHYSPPVESMCCNTVFKKPESLLS